jgi:hypothetical protein
VENCVDQNIAIRDRNSMQVVSRVASIACKKTYDGDDDVYLDKLQKRGYKA